MINHPKMAALYRALAPAERARMIARLARTGDTRELARLRDATPDEQAALCNHLLRIVRTLHAALEHDLIILILGAEYHTTLLLHVAVQIAHDRLRQVDLRRIWTLVPYPVTASEHARLLALERQRPAPLDACCWYMARLLRAEQARADGWRADVVALLEDAAIATEAEALAQARALLDAAIGRGELPAPTPSAEGPALPWGTLRDWLEPGSHEEYGPGYHVPAVELLAGDLDACWDIRPDGEAAAVQARREQIAQVLFDLARLDPAEWPSIHPPVTWQERDGAAAQIRERWPWSAVELGYQTVVEYIGAAQAPYRTKLRLLVAVLDEMKDQDFGGESPLSEPYHALVATAQAADEDYAHWWQEVGTMLATWPETAPPSVPEAPAAQAEEQLRQLRGIYRDMD
ncbi:MAG TPA: hypothetical protein VHB98_10265 [Chloroflexota bacterium]|nr:hypothetical protein [Chloroflexota bacterium]